MKDGSFLKKTAHQTLFVKVSKCISAWCIKTDIKPYHKELICTLSISLEIKIHSNKKVNLLCICTINSQMKQYYDINLLVIFISFSYTDTNSNCNLIVNLSKF